MKRIRRLVFYIKHKVTGKPKAIIISGPTEGTTSWPKWIGWKIKYCDAKFYEHNGLYLMTKND